MQQNLVLTNTLSDLQKSKLNLYFFFVTHINNNAFMFYLPYVYLSLLKVEYLFSHSHPFSQNLRFYRGGVEL